MVGHSRYLSVMAKDSVYLVVPGQRRVNPLDDCVRAEFAMVRQIKGPVAQMGFLEFLDWLAALARVLPDAGHHHAILEPQQA